MKNLGSITNDKDLVTKEFAEQLTKLDGTTVDRNSDDAIEVKDGGIDLAKFATNLIVTAIRDAISATDSNLPTEKAVRTQLDLKVDVSSIVDNLITASADAPLSANQGKELKTLIDALSGAVAIKVVEELPESPAKSTMYYVGTAAPYHIYLYDSDGNQHDLGTTEIDLSEYLKLSGGTMTGPIVAGGYAGIAVVNSNNGGEISFWGGTGSDSSMLRLMGKENAYSNGAWILSANDGTNSAQAEGHTDGTFSWGSSSLKNILSDTNGFQFAASVLSGKSIDDVVALATVDGSNKFLPLVLFTAADAPEGSSSDTYSVRIEKYNSSFYKLTAYSFSSGNTWVYTNVWGTKSGWKKIVTDTTGNYISVSGAYNSATRGVLANFAATSGETHFNTCLLQDGPDGTYGNNMFIEMKIYTGNTKGVCVIYDLETNKTYRSVSSGGIGDENWGDWTEYCQIELSTNDSTTSSISRAELMTQVDAPGEKHWTGIRILDAPYSTYSVSFVEMKMISSSLGCCVVYDCENAVMAISYYRKGSWGDWKEIYS